MTVAEVDATIQAELKQARLEYEQKLYELRSQAVDRFLSTSALEIQVEATEGVSSIPELLERDVLPQIAEVSDAEAEAFYEQNRARIGDTPKEEVLPMIKNYLKQQKQQEEEDKITQRQRTR